jgi:hypothetical protein
MPNNADAPALEVPAVLHIVKVNWDARDFRYPGYYPAPIRRPRKFHDLKSILIVLGCAAFLGAMFGIIYCIGG